MKSLILFLFLSINLYSQKFVCNTYEYWEGKDSASLSMIECTEDFVEYNLVGDVLTEKILNDTLVYVYNLKYIGFYGSEIWFYGDRKDGFTSLVTISTDYKEISFGYKKDELIKIHRYYYYEIKEGDYSTINLVKL